jgi:CHAT domain-containing protein/tetratricopeptide (TPR) repeat protein
MRLPRRTALVMSVGIVALACFTSACRPARPAPSGRDALAEAVADTLPFQARLSGGFAPSRRGPTRAAGDRAELSPDARIAIALLEKRAIETPTPEALADLGVGYLIQGDIDRAITTIEDAASQMTAAAPWSDLSAAYLAKAQRTPARKVEYLARAFDAAEKSLKVARTNDALFNRALARDGLAPYTGAGAEWQEYSSAENDPTWRETARAEAAKSRPVDNASVRWTASRKELAASVKAGDVAFIKEMARSFPEGCIEFIEQELFVDPTAIAGRALLASAIFEVTQDPMTRDEAALFKKHATTLAAAHQKLRQGGAQFAKDDLSGARQSWRDALRMFTAVNAPYRGWAEYQLGRLEWQAGRLEEAQRVLVAVEHDARRRGYRNLLARTLWQRGLAFNRQWRLTEGLAAFRESASLYEASNEREVAVGVYSNMADALRMLGERHESWSFIGRTLEGLSRLRRPLNRYLFLYNAALFAAGENLHEAAYLFQEAATREAAKAAQPGALAEATIQLALANVRRGELARARADLERAALQVAAAPAQEFRDFAGAELAIVRAQLGDGDDASIPKLQDAIGFFSKTDPGRVPGLYLLLARTPQARASPATAEHALRAGIDILEKQQAGLGDEMLRISYFDESWSLFQDMVALQVAARNTSAAFDFAERSRARSLLAAAQDSALSRTRQLQDIQSQLPPRATMVYYSTLADRVVVWTITAKSAQSTERAVTERELFRLIEQHRAAIRAHRENRQVNNRLYTLLIEPAAGAIEGSPMVVVVPDGALQQLAFATLRHPQSDRYLIEDHALLVSPSASFFVDSLAAAAASTRAPLQSALMIGNPAAEAVRPLPGAEAEATAAAALYPRHEVMIGRAATKERFVEAAPRFDVIHFGGHALVNPEFPLLSRLVFADQAQTSQSLYAHELSKLRFPRTRVVVLAACSTAAGAVSRGEGVVGVARPFLAGGVPVVIASQWDVDDRATEQLTLAFHRALAKSGNPVAALNAAQLSMLRSGDAIHALPESWGAFVAIGTAAP